VYRLLMLSRLDAVFNPLEIFSTLVGALAHDVGHPGLNNLFLVKSKHPLALTYNDRSPLENMHASVLYEVFMPCDAMTTYQLGTPYCAWTTHYSICLY